jgi:hypothetical protein
LLDLITARGEKGKWFAAAKCAGCLDIAIECAAEGQTEPSALIRAARDFKEKEPAFAAEIALRAIRALLRGYGYEPSTTDISQAYEHLMAAAKNLDKEDWARSIVEEMVATDSLCYDKSMRQTLIARMQGKRPII